MGLHSWESSCPLQPLGLCLSLPAPLIFQRNRTSVFDIIFFFFNFKELAHTMVEVDKSQIRRAGQQAGVSGGVSVLQARGRISSLGYFSFGSEGLQLII